MSRRTLLDVYRSWAFSRRHLGRTSSNNRVLMLEGFEERLAPAVLPTPTVLTPTATAAPVAVARINPPGSGTPVDYINPQVVADPLTAQNQVLVATSVTTATTLGVTARISTDFGATFTATSITGFGTRPRDPNLAFNANPNIYTDASSPSVAFGRDGTLYFVYLAHNAAKTSGAVMFQTATFGGNASAAKILYQWSGPDQALNPTIGVDNNLDTFTDPSGGAPYTDTLVNPVTKKSKGVYIAWNGNATATPGDVFTFSGVLNFNANPILSVVSGDDGSTWSNPTPVSDGGYLTSPTKRGIAPQIAFSPGNSGAPGALVFVWPQQVLGQNFARIEYESTRPDSGVVANAVPAAYTVSSPTFTQVTGAITEAGVAVSPATFDPSTPTTFTLNVPAATFTDPNFNLQDLSVNLAVVAPNLDQLRIILTAPNGNSVTLVNNRTLGDGSARTTPGGQPFAPGITSPAYNPANPLTPFGGLGVINGAFSKTVFSDTAARRISDPNSPYPYIGTFRPEGAFVFGSTVAFGLSASPAPLLVSAGGFGALYPTGTTAAGLSGTWTLTITDFRNDRYTFNSNPFAAPEFLSSFGLSFSSVVRGMGTDAQIAGAIAAPIGTDFNNAPLVGSATYPAVAPTTGVPSNVSIKFDTSLGSFTPFGGSLYVAYTGVSLNTANPAQVTDTNVLIAKGTVGAGGVVTFGAAVKVNDDTASDNTTEGNRPQFTPAVTVDATTGTVVATWYDTRQDANKTRAATFVATSIDGGASWSDQTITTSETVGGVRSYLSQPKNAIDVITGTTYTLQPVPTNVPQSSAFGLGIRQSVIASGGNIYAYWAGNANAVGSSILSAHAVTAAGPRVVAADMGVVTRASTVGAFTYNDTIAADGTRGIDGFTVTFDRRVDPATAPIAAFQVKYRNPYDSLVVAPTNIPVTSVTAIGADAIGATQFLIRFAPQFAVGTYSYAVGPNISDRVRTVVGAATVLGNPMDQNANAIAGQANLDRFATPTPINGTPFVAPYVIATQPLIIPGPHMVGSSVPNAAVGDDDLVLAGVATAVDVTFDRDINAVLANGPVFTTANVIRITGPGGVVYERGVSPITAITVIGRTARTYRIGFPPQVLSGTYTVEVDAQFAAALSPEQVAANFTPLRPLLVDTNLNAGLDILAGGNIANGVPLNTNYSQAFSGAAAVIPAAVGVVPGQADFPIVITDQDVILVNAGHHIQVQLNVSSAGPDSRNVIDLIAELIAPDGTVIRLFTNVGNPTRPLGTTPTLWFSNTVLADDANTPIQSGFQPFDNGPYNPQFPLDNLAGGGRLSAGTWTLRIFNSGAKTPNLNSWSLSLPKIVSGSGLGEVNADRFAVSFRIFNQNPTDNLTQKVWTAVGPASENGSGNTARTNGLAVDPSDPSGNTVYLGAASGGLWKTNDFLTQKPGGPSWLPLIDNGPTYSLNVVSIAVFPRNNDPQQSIVFALTGEGDTGTPGVGVLRSMDGGKTWVVLDSANNAGAGSTFGGTVSPIAAASRGREFFGRTQFKIIVDPAAVSDVDKNVIVYLAGSAGVWRSVDTGRHWTQIRAGNATDIVLSEGSAGATGNLQILYAAFQGDGIYRAIPAYAAASMLPIFGSVPGNGQFIDNDLVTQPRVPIAPPVRLPGGPRGRIMLATPALTNNPIQDLNYQGWLYALVVTANSSLDGLYITKDFGQNWTKISLAERLIGAPPIAGYGTNDYTQNDHDVFAAPPGAPNPLPGQGNYDIGFAIDPSNPYVVYIGGTNNNATSPNKGLIRVDTTGLMDAGAVVAYDNGAVDGGTIQFTAGTGNVVTKAGGNSETTGAKLGAGLSYGVDSLAGVNTGYLNVLRNPSAPFTASSPLFFSNVASIRNTGFGSHYSGFPAEVMTDVHRIIAFRDQTTGRTRLIVGDDQGVASAVDDGVGNILTQIGTGPQNVPLPSLIRNGNLQIVQFYSSTAQPSLFASEVAAALFYGEAQDDGFPVSNSDILQTGIGTTSQKLSWSGSTGDGTWGLTSQSGSGTYYDYKWPCCGGNNNEFFQVDGVGRTFGLIQPGDNPTTGVGNWGVTGGSQFAANPVVNNPGVDDGLAISSYRTGRLFLSTDQGRTWFLAAGPAIDALGVTDLGGYAPAIAYGSPDPTNPNQLNNFIYAGTGAGKIWVTFTGGSPWTDISAGLSGGGVKQIIPDPVRGSKAVYAVTAGGIFFKADASTAAPWVNITGNIFTRSEPIFSETNPAPQNGVPASLRGLTALAVDWRYAIPDASVGAPSTAFPILYAGGYGGVFRSLDRGATWQTYPEGTSYKATYTDQQTGLPGTVIAAVPVGGYLPAVEVTQLSLSFGNVDPKTGQPLQATGGLNLLTAGTYGRGTWVIRLEDLAMNANPAIAALAQFQVVKQAGPRVIGVTVTNVANTLRVQFDTPVLATTLTAGDIQIKDANGNVLTVLSITPLVDTVGPANRPTLPSNPSDYHDLFQVVFAPPPASSTGFARITIGPDITDYAGFGMNQNDNFANGETLADPNNGGAAADAYHGFIVLSDGAVPVVTTLADFSNGAGGLSLDGFTATGLWHATATAAGASTAGHTVPEIGYYGIDATNTYNNGAINAGDLTSSSAIVVPASPASTSLAFKYRLLTERLNPFDQASVQVSTDSGATFTTIASNGAGSIPETATWSSLTLDLSAFAGQTILLRFHFDTVDSAFNDFLGWQIDDVAITSVVPPLISGNLFIDMPTVTVAGDPTLVIVSILDPATGLPQAGYTGTIHFTSSETFPFPAYSTTSKLPSDYTFTAADKGTHSFTITFQTASAPAPSPLAPQTLIGVTDLSGTRNAAQDLVTVLGANANHFVVAPVVPATLVAGVAGTFKVTAADPFNNVDARYVGTATLTSTDPYLPGGAKFTPSAPYTFTSGSGATFDNGVHTFGVTLFTAGTQTITVTDATNKLLTLSGTRNVPVVAAALANLTVTGFASPTVAGAASNFLVSLTDQYGNPEINYVGSVTLTSTDPLATFVGPSTYTFTAGDAGMHTFNGTLFTAGNWTITGTDAANSVAGSQTGIQVTPAATSKLVVVGFASPVVAGVTKPFTVTASDLYGNTTPAYVGTVNLTSSDTKAVLTPNSYAFGAADGGTHGFTGILKTAGTQSISVSDSVLTGTQTGIVVTPAAANKVSVTGTAPTLTAGTATAYTVTLLDAFSNVATGYAGLVTFGSSDPQKTLTPTTYSFTAADMGTKTLPAGATLRTAGTQTVSASAALVATAGTSPNILVTAATMSQFLVSGYPSPVTAGSTNKFTVTASDKFGNVTTGYAGLVTVSSPDDPLATFGTPNPYAFTGADSGKHVFTGTLSTLGTRSIAATDGVSTGTQSGIAVTSNAATSLTVAGYPTSVVAGTANGFTVTLRDAFNNVATGYTGTVSIAGPNDPQSTFAPTPYTFTAADKGTHTFSGTFLTAGTQTITAAAPGLTINPQTGIAVASAAASTVTVTGFPGTVVAGTAHTFTVTARDPFGNLATGFTGTVTFSSSDSQASFAPSPFAFTAGDGGTHAFTGTLQTAGTQLITVAVAGVATIPQTGIAVTPAPVSPPPPGPVPPIVPPSVPPPPGPPSVPPTAVAAFPLPTHFGVGSGTGGLPDVFVYDQTATPIAQVRPFPTAFTGGTRVAVADVTGDGVDDIIVGTGPGVTSSVQVIDGKTQKVLFTYQPFEDSFIGGVYVTAGDITGDGVAEIAITPDQGGGPRVVVLRGKDFVQIANFFGIDDADFRGGARASIGDINNDGFGDLAIAAGFGGGPRVAAFDGKSLVANQQNRLFSDFFIFDGPDADNLRNGAFLSVADINGDGFADLIGGGGPGGGPRVQIFNGQEKLAGRKSIVANFFAGNKDNRGGVRVSAKDLDGDKFADLVVGDGDGAGSQVTAYRGSKLAGGNVEAIDSFNAFPGIKAGVYVG